MIVLYALASYLLGSCLFGIWIARLCGKDLRKEGSGNVGATNVFRTLGFAWGTVVLLLDTGKGALPVYLAFWSGHNLAVALLCGCCAIIGHSFPIFAGFKGGKAVSTSFGVVLAALPMLGVLLFVIWFVVMMVSRKVSVASVVSAFAAPTIATVIGAEPLVRYGLVPVAVLIVYLHLPNIRRLLQQEEPDAPWFKKKEVGDVEN